jgi:sulfhydrogenase subunit beta (sulfur reductase)
MHYVILNKDRLDDFVIRLAEFSRVAAPVSKGHGSFAFEYVTSAQAISMTYIPTILPPKKYFMPQRETLLEFNLGEKSSVEAVADFEAITLFGVHTCDLAAIQCLNMVFSERPRDCHYLLRKKHIDLIGFECNDYCDEYANCAAMDTHLPAGGYDLFFSDLGDDFIVDIATQRGEEIVGKTAVFINANDLHLSALSKLRENKKSIFKNELAVASKKISDLFDRSFGSTVWKDLQERCLACGNCTAVCPTCYCFDIRDEIDLDLTSGRRYRIWDSCQLEPFAKVAGGENFRKERSTRQRHRYYRKFRYPLDKYGRFFCTGCGRCSRTCMASIRLKETLQALARESESRIWKGWL